MIVSHQFSKVVKTINIDAQLLKTQKTRLIYSSEVVQILETIRYPSYKTKMVQTEYTRIRKLTQNEEKERFSAALNKAIEKTF